MEMEPIDRIVMQAKRSAVESESARRTMMDAARRRQEMILALKSLGLSVRQIARRLGCSAAVVQNALKMAQARRPLIERREDRVPYELHVQLCLKLKEDERRIKDIGKVNLARMRRIRRNPLAQNWVDEWDKVLDGPIEELESRMLADDERGREMRQMSPFAGALTDEERHLSIRKARELAPR